MDYFLIHNVDLDKIKLAARGIVVHFASEAFAAEVELHKVDRQTDTYCITFKNDLSFEGFLSCLEYLRYPIDTHYDAEVEGFYSVKESDEEAKEIIGKRVKAIFSASDNIELIADDNTCFKLSNNQNKAFLTEMENNNQFDESKLELTPIEKFDKSIAAKEEKALDSRLLIFYISILVVAAIVLGLFFLL